MARRKVPERAVPTQEEVAREAANAAGEARREKEKAAKRANVEKQARFRKSMKEQGYREVKFWEKSPPSGMVKPWGKNAPPLIQESSAGVCEKDTAIREAVKAPIVLHYGGSLCPCFPLLGCHCLSLVTA
jgi:hypothetical protein